MGHRAMQLAREFSNGCIKGILCASIQTRNDPVFRDKDLGTSFTFNRDRMELGFLSGVSGF